MFRPEVNGAARWRAGLWLDGRIGDLAGAYRRYRSEGHSAMPGLDGEHFPATLLELLNLEQHALDYTGRLAGWLDSLLRREPRAVGVESAPLGWRTHECVLDAPLRPGKLITLARNYHEHVAEHGLMHSGKVPSASIKASSSLVGPYHDIIRPNVETQLDYETELCLVIGTRCRNVREEDAYKVIAGYTVLSDIVARRVLKIERDAGNQFLGKMFDTFGPLGPCLVTKDEIEDPMNLTISTRVNGKIRQRSNTARMIWKIPQLVAYFSQATLEPGDLISTGTPAGVAAGRKPNEEPWYLLPGDVIESEVERVGVLRNCVVQEQPRSATWNWDN